VLSVNNLPLVDNIIGMTKKTKSVVCSDVTGKSTLTETRPPFMTPRLTSVEKTSSIRSPILAWLSELIAQPVKSCRSVC